MSTRWVQRRFVVLAVIIVSFISAYRLAIWMASRSSGSSPPREHVHDGLAVDAEALDVGEVWESNEIPFRLAIANVTNTDAKVVDFLTSCACIEVAPRSLTIPANEKGMINVKLDLSRRSQEQAGLAIRPFETEIIPVLLNGGRQPRSGWVLHGTVRSRVTLDAVALHFGDAPVYREPMAPRKVLATTHVPVQAWTLSSILRSQRLK
jgi:hypothetical protein